MINSLILLVLIALFEKYCHDRYCENLHHDESLSRDLNSNLGLEKKLVELYLVYFNQHIFFVLHVWIVFFCIEVDLS